MLERIQSYISTESGTTWIEIARALSMLEGQLNGCRNVVQRSKFPHVKSLPDPFEGEEGEETLLGGTISELSRLFLQVDSDIQRTSVIKNEIPELLVKAREIDDWMQQLHQAAKEISSGGGLKR